MAPSVCCIDPPNDLQGNVARARGDATNLRRPGDRDVERPIHSQLRSSARIVDSGVVCFLIALSNRFKKHLFCFRSGLPDAGNLSRSDDACGLR